MILGAQLSLRYLQTGETIDDRIVSLKKLGIGAVEINGERRWIEEVAPKLSKQRIEIIGLWGSLNPCHPDEATRRRLYDQTVDLIELSSKLEGRMPVFIGPGSRDPRGGWIPHKDNYTDSAFQMSVKGLKGLCKVAEDYDIVLGLEAGVSTVAYSGKRCAQLTMEVGSDRLRMHMDACNFITFPFVYYDNTAFLNELFDDLHGKIIDGHLKDFKAEEGHNITTVMKHVPPGKGNMDWDTYLMRLDREIGTKGYAVFEYITLEELPEAKAFIKAKAKALGITVR